MTPRDRAVKLLTDTLYDAGSATAVTVDAREAISFVIPQRQGCAIDHIYVVLDTGAVERFKLTNIML